MKTTKLILFALLVLSLTTVNAQDIHFSQQTEAPLNLNPAFTGFYNGHFRANVNYRNQWQAMGKAFQTMNVTADAGLFKSKRRKTFLGLGIQIFQDKAGAANLRKTHALINLSGLVKISKRSVLSAGICGGAIGTNANYDKLTFASQFDGNEMDAEANNQEKVNFRSFTTTDFGAGIAYEVGSVKVDQDHDDEMKVRIGLAAYHLNKPKQEFSAGASYRLPIRYVASIISSIDFEDTKLTVTPTFIAQKQGGKYAELQKTYAVRGGFEFYGGSYLKLRMATGTKVTGEKTQNAFGLGLFYRYKDALVPAILVELGDYAFGLSYDLNISGYKAASKLNGGFEVSLRYNKLTNNLFATRGEY
ncbi:MAG: PorP/SprF family type IX secretion system membrane protein [Bacteroidia bacterium]